MQDLAALVVKEQRLFARHRLTIARGRGVGPSLHGGEHRTIDARSDAAHQRHLRDAAFGVDKNIDDDVADGAGRKKGKVGCGVGVVAQQGDGDVAVPERARAGEPWVVGCAGRRMEGSALLGGAWERRRMGWDRQRTADAGGRCSGAARAIGKGDGRGASAAGRAGADRLPGARGAEQQEKKEPVQERGDRNMAARVGEEAHACSLDVEGVWRSGVP